MFGHKLRYKIKVTFGGIFPKLRQTSWNVARNSENVVVGELPSQMTIYTCLTINNWTQRHRRGFKRFGDIRPNWQALSEIDAKSFRVYYGHS